MRQKKITPILPADLYQRVTSISGPRVLLALGGWTDSSGDKYSRLASSVPARRKFATSAVHFLRKHGFRGLSLEWNYPGCWQSDCRRGPSSDRANFARLLAELRREFDREEPRLTLAVALSGYKEVIDKGYDVAQISKLVDFMTVMSYDYHGAWESQTSHLAPLFAIPGDSTPYYNMVSRFGQGFSILFFARGCSHYNFDDILLHLC